MYNGDLQPSDIHLKTNSSESLQRLQSVRQKEKMKVHVKGQKI